MWALIQSVNYRPVCREDRIRMAQSMILIKGGEVVNEDGRQMADVYIEDKIIKQVGKNLDVPSEARVIDATGKLVIPGGYRYSYTLSDAFHGHFCCG